MQDDQREDDVEPKFVEVARLVRRVGADRDRPEDLRRCRPRPRDTGRDRPGLRLRRARATTLSAPSGVWPMPAPSAVQIVEHSRAGRARNWRSARSSCRRRPTAGGRSASVRIAHARPDVPIGVVVLDRPPAERDQRGEQPVEQPDRQVPDGLGGALLAQWCISARYLSWQALQVLPRSPNRALIASTSLPFAAAALNGLCGFLEIARAWRRSPAGSARFRAWRRSCRRSGPVPAGNQPDDLRARFAMLRCGMRGRPRGPATRLVQLAVQSPCRPCRSLPCLRGVRA